MLSFTCLITLLMMMQTVLSAPRDANDVEAFRNFLKKTNYGKYQEPLSPELEDLQNTWERSGKFEGDILLTEDQQDLLVRQYNSKDNSRNALVDSARLWTQRTLYYAVNTTTFTAEQASAIDTAVAEIANVSCVRFVKRTSESNYVIVQGNSGGCYSSVGMTKGAQTLNLAPSSVGSGCFRKGTIIHEFLHALGFYHQQSTFNRDDFVEIVWDKIQKGAENNFKKYTDTQVTNLGVLYDYGSVLHYSQFGFSTDGNKTIVPLKPTNATIGQRAGMSAGDITKLNKLYGCTAFKPIQVL